jgi:hypothetical protein
MLTRHGRDDIANWVRNAEQDAIEPTVSGHVVIAATAVHRMRELEDEWIIEQYCGPDSEESGADLSRHLRLLSRAVAADRVIPVYDGVAPGGVVHVEPDIAGSIDEHMIALCPRAAETLGWRADSRDAFTYLDGDGQMVARTLRWRDGGIRSHQTDRAVFSEGHVLIVKEAVAERVRSFAAPARIARAWRIAQKQGGRGRAVEMGSRPLANIAP